MIVEISRVDISMWITQYLTKQGMSEMQAWHASMDIQHQIDQTLIKHADAPKMARDCRSPALNKDKEEHGSKESIRQ